MKKKTKTRNRSKGHLARDEATQTSSSSGYAEKVQAFQNLEYKGTVSVGTPPQVFEVVMDTGSDVFWLPKKGCQSSGPCLPLGTRPLRPQRVFDRPRPPRSLPNLVRTGSATGDYYNDVMSFGDAKGEHVSVGNVTLGAASRATFSDEGILGLSFAQSGDPTPIFQLAVQRGVFQQPIFSVYLADCDGDCDDGGLIKFGGTDTQNCENVVGSVNVVGNSPYWLFPLGGITANRQTIRIARTMHAITDTGTSIIAGPSALIRQMAAVLGAREVQSTYLVPCNAQLQLSFLINGREYTINEAQLVLEGAVGMGGGSSYCQLALDGDDQLDFLILGIALHSRLLLGAQREREDDWLCARPREPQRSRGVHEADGQPAAPHEWRQRGRRLAIRQLAQRMAVRRRNGRPDAVWTTRSPPTRRGANRSAPNRRPSAAARRSDSRAGGFGGFPPLDAGWSAGNNPWGPPFASPWGSPAFGGAGFYDRFKRSN
ncbi:Eukaryotic aspartyl protease [Aphelenchoides fujianensis]|nr:Eukaryotic aspartyl protease [Aphelenchoides fujianensis]